MTPTPVLTVHARQRCAEMEISTKVAKAILRHADLTRPTWPSPCRIATSTQTPEYAVVYVEDDPRPVIVTVLFRTDQPYRRDGATFVLVASEQDRRLTA
jgi:hypothetical protein